jgi:hypothetical protein
MSELVAYAPPDAAGALVSWAVAARSAGELAATLVRTTIVPEAFRIGPATPPAQAELVIGNATAAILLGAELGLTPIAALRSLYVIRGQVGTYTQAKVALVKSRGHSIWTEDETDTSVTVAGYRRGEPEHVERVTWTIERARTAGLMRRGRNGELSQYESQPRTMLYARAAGDVARRVAPDVLLGIPEDADEPTATGESVPQATNTIRRATKAPPAVIERPAVSGDAPRDDANDTAERDSQSTPEDAEGRQDPIPNTDAAPGETPDELVAEPPAITGSQSALVHALYRAQGLERDAYLRDASAFVGRELTTTGELTKAEASRLIDALQAEAERP